MARFEPGRSGNPAGKPRGAVCRITKLRRSIEDAIPGILAALTEKALAGDTAAAKLLLERSVAPLKATAPTVQLPDLAGENLTLAARSVLQAVGEGTLAPDAGAQILQGLIGSLRQIEQAELEARIESLEKKQNEQH